MTGNVPLERLVNYINPHASNPGWVKLDANARDNDAYYVIIEGGYLKLRIGDLGRSEHLTFDEEAALLRVLQARHAARKGNARVAA